MITGRGHILLVDDDAEVREAASEWLQLAGFEVEAFADPRQIPERITPDYPGILISDVRMPHLDGQQLLQAVLAIAPELPVILITGHGSVDMAVATLRDGAYDFIEKPYNPERLIERINRALEKRRLTLENLRLQARLSARGGLENRLIGVSPAMVRLRADIERLAAIDANLIIHGETGSGKELVATCLHQLSDRRRQPFVPLNCGAIPESLFESELFGHEAGAFTGASKRRIGKYEYADGGTLFMDEIESMPLNLQVKVLRTLQEGVVERLGDNRVHAVDVRVLAATKMELRGNDAFRQDLYYRLNLGEIRIPALRERREDIPLLFDHWVAESAREHQREPRRLSEYERRTLERYHWPGNVRELRNVALRYSLDAAAGLNDLLGLAPPPSAPVNNLTGASLSDQLQAFEVQVIKSSLQRHQGNVQAVLDELDLPRRTLNQKMQKYGIQRGDFTD
ncbi:sigma-54-dependent transcriptional regulator [Motiliproteus sediminis]|uniref:sigma-54-dependent transcriptional regulator n=1 Tax=Motiliproteus sediminis TaxID=1468178 RepID=UPI001AEFAAE2|nr:sigma-54 dependent transcriptional regulator [Motiliproteus sediminis]